MATIEHHMLLRECPWCGYALEGLPIEHVCPECGHAFDRRLALLGGMAVWKRMTTRRRWLTIAGSVVWLVVLLWPYGQLGLPRLTVLYGVGWVAAEIGSVYISKLRMPPQFALIGPDGVRVCSRKTDSTDHYAWRDVEQAKANGGNLILKVNGQSVTINARAAPAEAKAFAAQINDYLADLEDESD